MNERSELTELRMRVAVLEHENAELRDDNEQLERQFAELEAELAAAAVAEVEIIKGSDEEQVYYASSRKRHFHRPGCKWAKYIVNSASLIEFSSHREAVEAGYKPCKTCRS
jgi:hypothetical protein